MLSDYVRLGPAGRPSGSARHGCRGRIGCARALCFLRLQLNAGVRRRGGLRGANGRDAIIPESDDYLSFLMGADAIPDDELTDLGVKILKGANTPFRGLLIPGEILPAYKALIRDRLTPGFWNDILGRHEILFIFKLKDGSVTELALSEATRSEIARLCSSLNNDPIEKTSEMPRYLAGNPFYREAIEAFHGHAQP